MCEEHKAFLDEMGVAPEDRRNVMWRRWATKLEPDQLDEILKKLQWGLGTNNVWRAAVIEARRRLGRLTWLHNGGEKDPEGFEWGIFRVRWNAQGRPAEVFQTLSDMSDLDAEMAREASLENVGDQPRAGSAATPEK